MIDRLASNEYIAHIYQYSTLKSFNSSATSIVVEKCKIWGRDLEENVHNIDQFSVFEAQLKVKFKLRLRNETNISRVIIYRNGLVIFDEISNKETEETIYNIFKNYINRLYQKREKKEMICIR